MKLRILNIDAHRNGIDGAPFHAIVFREIGTGGSVKLGIVFDGPGHVAVLDISMLSDCDVEFGSNSWRGDCYEPALRRAIARQRKVVESALRSKTEDRPQPIVAVTVQGGLVTDVNATVPTWVLVEDWDCPPDRPLVMDFESKPLTQDQEQRVRQRLAENESTVSQTNSEPSTTD